MSPQVTKSAKKLQNLVKKVKKMKKVRKKACLPLHSNYFPLHWVFKSKLPTASCIHMSVMIRSYDIEFKI